MACFITYKDKTEIDAIAAWCEDHSSALGILRRLFAPGINTVKEAIQTTFKEEFGKLKGKLANQGILDGLYPDDKWKDAKIYMARLVCYVWNNLESYGSNAKATDYVYRIAREGCRLYADCCYARALLKKYGKQIATIRKEAKILHAKETHFKRDKWSGMEKPPTMSQLAKASKAREVREERKCRKMAKR